MLCGSTIPLIAGAEKCSGPRLNKLICQTPPHLDCRHPRWAINDTRWNVREERGSALPWVLKRRWCGLCGLGRRRCDGRDCASKVETESNIKSPGEVAV